MALKRISKTKGDNNWGKQALFLTFAQNGSIIILKALFMSYSGDPYKSRFNRWTNTKLGLPVDHTIF